MGEMVMNSEKQKKLYVQGGTIMAIGGLESGSSISNGTCKYTTSWSGNEWYALYNGDDIELAFQTPGKASMSGGGGPGGNSSQQLVVYTSSAPNLKSGVTVSGGTEYFSGMINIGGAVKGGASVTLSEYSGNNGGIPGGGVPGEGRPGNW